MSKKKAPKKVVLPYRTVLDQYDRVVYYPNDAEDTENIVDRATTTAEGEYILYRGLPRREYDILRDMIEESRMERKASKR